MQIDNDLQKLVLDRLKAARQKKQRLNQSCSLWSKRIVSALMLLSPVLHCGQEPSYAYTPTTATVQLTGFTEVWSPDDLKELKASKRLAMATPYKPVPIQLFKTPYSKLKPVTKKQPSPKAIAVVRKPTKKANPSTAVEVAAEDKIFPWHKRKRLSDEMRYKIISNTVKLEGGYNPNDSNGHPVKYGVNEAYYRPLPGFPRRVKDLTKNQAIKYYMTYYYSRNWEYAGYKPEYIAFLLDANVQHGNTYKRFERGCKGDLSCSVKRRAAYSVDWARRTGNHKLIAGLSNRNKSFKNLKIV